VAQQIASLFARIGADTSGLTKGLATADSRLRTTSAKMADMAGMAGKLAASVTLATGAVAGLATASGALAIKLAADAAPLEGIEAAFQGITSGGDDMLRMLREQSAGMISDRELMRSYNQAAQLVSKTFADQLPDAMRYLGKVAAATGQDMDYLMGSLVTGVGRLSPMILDNLSIQVSLAEANEKYAKQIGKTADELTKEERQIALTNQVMEKLAANTAKMPDVTGTATQGLGALGATMKNIKEDIGRAFLPALKELLSFLNVLAPAAADAAAPALRSIGDWIADITRRWKAMDSRCCHIDSQGGQLGREHR